MPTLDGPDYATIAADIGLAALRAQYPALTGAGLTVGQVEGSSSGTQGGIDTEIDPASLGHPADNADHFFTYINGATSSFTYNDGLAGTFSSHATVQATFFYNPTPYLGAPEGVAPGVAHVNSYNADNFLRNLAAAEFTDTVVNLSVVYTGIAGIDADFDRAANRFDTVFVAAAGNGGKPGMPSSAYNVISVDTWPDIQAIGPAPDGVPKPDISAPQTVTSRTTAIVSGAATLLVQAGRDGIGGASTQARADARDFRTIKALLLNGATKPADYFSTIYAPTAEQPLNAVYGAGVVNIANSVANLAAGEVFPGTSYSVTAGNDPYVAIAGAALGSAGWALAMLASLPGQDAVHGYAITLAAGIGFEATLTWAADDSNQINHLLLYLYDDATGALIAASTSSTSNVQQITAAPDHGGRFDLAVVLQGSANQHLTDRYALAFAGATSIACFAAGTRILTGRGEIAVETLRPDDRIATLSGRLAPIRFIGRRSLDPADGNATPIRIRAGAIAPGMPHRDLLLSPDHAVALRDATGVALVPARLLANGHSIAPGPQRRITYLHIELDHHDILVAEGLPAETYLDTGNRTDFANAADAPPGRPDLMPCAPLLLGGRRLAAFHAAVAQRGRPHDALPDPLLRADGTWLTPIRQSPGFAAFAVPPNTGDIRLVSRTVRPDWLHQATPDDRRLGLALLRLALDNAPVPLAALASPHRDESHGDTSWRWTDGNTALALTPRPRQSLLELWWEPAWPRWTLFDRAAGKWSE